MFELLLVLLIMIGAVLFVAVYGFPLACYIVQLWTGKNEGDAADDVHDTVNQLMNSTPNYILSEEFFEEMWDTVRTLINDQRYNQIYKLSRSNLGEPFLSRDINSSLPKVRMSVFCTDDNERQCLESALTTVITKYLGRSRYDTRVLKAWKKRADFNMDVLEVLYATNRKQQKMLDSEFASHSKKIIAMNTAVVDDTEDVDLFE